MTKDITKDDLFEPIIISIQEVADAFNKIKNSKLSEKAILLLIKDACGVPMHEIEKVLNAAATLDKRYLKSKS